MGDPAAYAFDQLRRARRPGDIMQDRPDSYPSTLPQRSNPSVGLPPKPGSINVPRRLPRDRDSDYYNGGHHDHYDRGHHGHRYDRGRDTVVIIGGGNSGFCFNGYVSTYHPRLTVYSPFSIYSCPAYIRTDCVVNTYYPYQYGRETFVFLPYSDNDTYYRSNVRRGQALRAALNDLIRFWEDNDARALREHVSPDLSIGVFQDEKYAFSLRRNDFLDLSADALNRVTTLSFRFDSVRDRSDGLVNVYATHLYRVRGERQTRTAGVRYTLLYLNGEWYVSAISHTTDIAR